MVEATKLGRARSPSSPRMLGPPPFQHWNKLVCAGALTLVFLATVALSKPKPLLVAAAVAPAFTEELACQQPLPESDCTSETQPDPPIEEPAPGRRARLAPFQGMEYQLYLPSTWRETGSQTYPVVVFLHGAGDGKFSVMNSQSLPRLLARNQSTCFDSRSCWCLSSEYRRARAKMEAPPDSPEPFLEDEEDLASPMAVCDFADTFEFIAVMPQGWLPQNRVGWTQVRLSQVEMLTKHVLERYRGDPARVSLTGQSAGGSGAWHFASLRPSLWASVSVVCAPAPPELAMSLDGLPIWVVGWTGDGEMGNDDIVAALKQRQSGSVRYTRYTLAPPPPDPLYNYMVGHASYDLIYRDPRLWQWALSHRKPAAKDAWGLPD
ncbi:Ank2 [Symbiodinium natans]|uniref:Ank2 protein n=1 Tax=Symbiodinium natans TaxID=878477 RepID=A0A812S080_9DINO|nr:Ank2 [Symbiodinium natans]